MDLKKVKNLGCIGGILLIFVLLCNTNNNPTSFLMRILPPITIARSRFYYGNLLLLIAIYFLIKTLYKVNEWSFLNHGGKRFLCWILVVAFIGIGCEGMVKIYKSFQTGLKAVYLEREKMNFTVKYHTENENNKPYIVYETSGYITLENCSNAPTEPFRVRLIDMSQDEGSDFQLYMDEYHNKDEEYILSPKQKIKIDFDNVGKREYTSKDDAQEGYIFSGNKFEVVLYNDTEQVVFDAKYN